MAYATAADLLERFESDLIAQRAAPEGLRVTGELLQLTVDAGDRGDFSDEEIAAADTGLARINEVLLDASGAIDGYLSDLYVLPLTPVPRMIKRFTCEVARFYLWGDAATVGGVEERDYKAAIKTLEAIRKGDVKLGVQPEPVSTPGRVDAEFLHGTARMFTRDSQRGL